MPPRSLPGFYYDESRGKYFKILPNHIAPADSKYSKDAVRKTAEGLLKRAREDAIQETRTRTKIAKSKVLRDPILGAMGVGREKGAGWVIGRGGVMAWAKGLASSVACDYDGEATLFAYDEATGSFVIVPQDPHITGEGITDRGLTTYAVPTQLKTRAMERQTRGKRIQPRLSRGVMLGSQIVSLAISPARALMTTAMGSSQPASIHITRLNPPESVQITDAHAYSNPTTTFEFTSDISITIRSSIPNVTFWASAPRPYGSANDFALATSHSTVLIAEEESGWTMQHQMPFPNWAESRRDHDILAVDWLNTNVTLNAARDGSVVLWDVRSAMQEATVSSIKHPSTISHVRKVNDCKVVVAGMENQLAVYDLRFLRTASSLSSASNTNNKSATTNPYLTFPTYHNRHLNGIAVGFDIHGDIIAAGTDDNHIQIFDAGSGAEIGVGMGGQLRRNLGGRVRCVRFVDGEEGGEGVRLLLSAGKGVEEWAW